MSASCPKCHRKETWSSKWAMCSACNYADGGTMAEGRRPLKPTVTENVTKRDSHAKRDENVTNGVTQTLTTSLTDDDGDSVQYVSVGPMPGEPCPTCGRKVPMTAVQRKKRQRTKGVA